MAIDPTLIGLSSGGAILLIIIIFISGSPFLSLIVVAIILGILVYILNLIGVITITTKDNKLDIKFMETPPAPAPTKTILTNTTQGSVLQQKEVFHISGNKYTYSEAPAVCAAYEAELASYDQVLQAYSSGAEWCGYGWSQGGMALYPTQEATWQRLIQEADEAKRTSCGRPGVNGGYLDPNTKIGVNCYGVKPGDKGTTYPVPVAGVDTTAFNSMVQRFKSAVGSMTVMPFNRTGWSEWNVGQQLSSSLSSGTVEPTTSVSTSTK